MKRSWILLAVAALALSVGSVMAGGEGYKCDANTQDCLDQMTADLQKKGWMGIKLDETHDGRHQITEVIADSPAMKAGFKAEDILVAMDGIWFSEENHEKVMKARKAQHPGSKVTYTVERNGKNVDLKVKLAKVPQDVLAQWIGGHMLDHANVEIAQN